MRTTIRLDNTLFAEVKKEATRRGETFTSLVEQGLRLVLASPIRKLQNPRVRLPVCRAGGGTLPGVDLTDSAALLDRLEGSA